MPLWQSVSLVTLVLWIPLLRIAFKFPSDVITTHLSQLCLLLYTSCGILCSPTTWDFTVPGQCTHSSLVYYWCAVYCEALSSLVLACWKQSCPSFCSTHGKSSVRPYVMSLGMTPYSVSLCSGSQSVVPWLYSLFALAPGSLLELQFLSPTLANCFHKPRWFWRVLKFKNQLRGEYLFNSYFALYYVLYTSLKPLDKNPWFTNTVH